MTDASHLVLGTAQLGMAYGVANRVGRLDRRAADEVLDAAWDGGIRTFDTAQSYGTSETAIGDWCRRSGCAPQIVTKVSPDVEPAETESVLAAAERSAERLGRPPSALLLHDPAALDRWDAGVSAALAACVASGLAERIGVSVYDPEDALRASALGLDVVQAPFSALDQRLRQAGILAAPAMELHVRSVYLQGLLTLDAAARPPLLAQRAAPSLRRWDAICRDEGRPATEVALLFVLQTAPAARVVVGAETAAQVSANVAIAAATPLSDQTIGQILALPPAPADVIDPRTWRAEAR